MATKAKKSSIRSKKRVEVGAPMIKEGAKVTGIITTKYSNGVILSCENGSFDGVIMPKEVRELEKGGLDLAIGTTLEVEILSTDVLHEEGYYIVSVTRLLQHDIWKSVHAKFESDELVTVVPTEANLGGLLIDMHGIKGFIPLSQLSPVNYPRVEDGNQEAIFDKLVQLVGKEFKVRIITIDEDAKRIIFSEREAMREERDDIMKNLAVGNMYDGTISGISSYGLFVTIGGCIEGLVHISEITYGHVDTIDKFGKVGDKTKVKVISLDDGKISLSIKQIKEDPRSAIANKFTEGDVIQGEIIRFVPYGAFMRIYDDINGLIHITEITDRAIYNPAEALKLGEVTKAKIIVFDPKARKIGLSIRALVCEEKGIPYEISKTALALKNGPQPRRERTPRNNNNASGQNVQAPRPQAPQQNSQAE
ncbi:MAG TPA: S1 RNA-binding domain-containing protein [Candidatus Absconditabacterales bacterium]|nr:S1 RNA-binding domain-containing protein [Candidatus Absconditabacterales bacterium]HNG96997.1 S1 RNA-binding domain-containing protein [Candidatus Absconditabacterales bacterium]